MLVDDQDLYFLTYDASDPKRLQRCSKTDCSAPVSLPFRLAVGQMANRAAPVRALVSDGTHIYGYYDDQGYQQSLRCTKPDCTDAADQKPAVTAVDDRYYYAGGSRRPKASTDTGMIAAGGSSGSVDFVTEVNVALADGYAYWLTPDRDHPRRRCCCERRRPPLALVLLVDLGGHGRDRRTPADEEHASGGKPSCRGHVPHRPRQSTAHDPGEGDSHPASPEAGAGASSSHRHQCAERDGAVGDLRTLGHSRKGKPRPEGLKRRRREEEKLRATRERNRKPRGLKDKSIRNIRTTPR